MKLADLSPNPRNPRKITDEKLKMLSKALTEFGDLSGFIFNRRTKRLSGGHQRKQVMPEDCVITYTKQYETPTEAGTVAIGNVEWNGELYAYREVDVDEFTEKAMNIAANKGAGQWDYPLLTDWVLELDHNNFDLSLTMFDMEERENLFSGKAHDLLKNDKEASDQQQFIVAVHCENELQMEELFSELQGRGLKCNLIR